MQSTIEKKPVEYRYTKSKGDREKLHNIHIREMIEMIKNEKVEDVLQVKHIRISNHAYQRVKSHFGIDNINDAAKKVRLMLRKAVRIGTVLSYDGRINVLFAYQQTAFYLSPDLKILVTVNKYPKVTYKQLLHKVRQGADRDHLIKLHYDLLKEIEEQEQKHIKKILVIEQRVRETTEQLVGFLHFMRSPQKHSLKAIISEMNLELKLEGRKLFDLKVEKRHICKSLVALY